MQKLKKGSLLFSLLISSLITFGIIACSSESKKQSIYIDQSLRGTVKSFVVTVTSQDVEQNFYTRAERTYSQDKELLRMEMLHKYGEDEYIFIKDYTHHYDENLLLESVNIKSEQNGEKTDGVIMYTYPEQGIVMGKEFSRGDNNMQLKVTKHFIKNGLEMSSESSEGNLESPSESVIRLSFEYDDSKNLTLERLEHESIYASGNETQTSETHIEYLDFDKQDNWIKAIYKSIDNEGKVQILQASREIEYY